jgi:hypothetical protein
MRYNKPTRIGFYWVETFQEQFPVEVIYASCREALRILIFGSEEEYTFDDFEKEFGVLKWLGACKPPTK